MQGGKKELADVDAKQTIAGKEESSETIRDSMRERGSRLQAELHTQLCVWNRQ